MFSQSKLNLTCLSPASHPGQPSPAAPTSDISQNGYLVPPGCPLLPPECILGASWVPHPWFLQDSSSMIPHPWFLLQDSSSMIPPPWFLLHDYSSMIPPPWFHWLFLIFFFTSSGNPSKISLSCSVFGDFSDSISYSLRTFWYRPYSNVSALFAIIS